MRTSVFALLLSCTLMTPAGAGDKPSTRIYENRLIPLKNAPPLLADHPEYVEPISTGPRFEAPLLIDDVNADLDVRAWRFSYNARGIIEVHNRLAANATAITAICSSDIYAAVGKTWATKRG